jgi:hypothetical protein
MCWWRIFQGCKKFGEPLLKIPKVLPLPSSKKVWKKVGQDFWKFSEDNV